MAGETIGDGNCKCVFEFDKHYIVKSLEEIIEKEAKKIEDIRLRLNELETIISEAPTESEIYDALIDAKEQYPGIIRIHESYRKDLIEVLKRVNSTPTCDER